MSLSIRTRLGLIFSLGMVAITGLLLVVTAQQARHHIKALYLERGEVAARELGNRAKRLFELGLYIEELKGFEGQCAEIAVTHDGVGHALLLGPDGRVAYASNGVLHHRGGPDTVGGVVTPASLGVEGIGVRHEVRRAGQIEAVAMVAVDTRAINAEVRQLQIRILLIGAVTTLLGIVILMAFLGRSLGRPTRQVISHIQSIDPGNLSGSPPDLHLRNDEIGTIAVAFDKLVASLAEAQTSLRQANQALSEQAARLEQEVMLRTAELRSRNQDLKDMARTDALTGLPNRRFFMETLEEKLGRERSDEQPLAVFMVDLNGFKAVNDRHGHTMGDYALEMIAKRVSRGLRENDFFARYGGDEFVLITEGFSGQEDLVHVAERLANLISQPFRRDGPELCVGASIGIALCRGDSAMTADELISAADSAMYRAKGSAETYAFAQPRA